VLPREAETFEQEVSIRLMGDCGLRVPPILGDSPSCRTEHQAPNRDGIWWVEFVWCYRTVSRGPNWTEHHQI